MKLAHVCIFFATIYSLNIFAFKHCTEIQMDFKPYFIYNNLACIGDTVYWENDFIFHQGKITGFIENHNKVLIENSKIIDKYKLFLRKNLKDNHLGKLSEFSIGDKVAFKTASKNDNVSKGKILAVKICSKDNMYLKFIYLVKNKDEKTFHQLLNEEMSLIKRPWNSFWKADI